MFVALHSRIVAESPASFARWQLAADDRHRMVILLGWRSRVGNGAAAAVAELKLLHWKEVAIT
jgi:hypothetical protein